MAFRASNTITFTEQKKIVEIKEWYLATDHDIILTSENKPETAEEGQLWFNKSNDSDTRLLQFVDGEWTVYSSQFVESIQKADSENRYLWNYEEVIYSIGKSEISLPIIISTYGSISDIINYYQVTKTPQLKELQDDNWTDKFSDITLSSTDKYLWNYEVIIYADGSVKQSDPAIIGVYGDSGEDAISFKIYSTDGLEFIDDIDEQERVDTINLKLSVYKGSKPLSENITFTWYWYGEIIEYTLDETVTSDTVGEYYILDGDEYVAKTLPAEYDSTMQYYISTSKYDYQVIDGYENTTVTILPVNINDKYAFADLKCEMTYTTGDYILYQSVTNTTEGKYFIKDENGKYIEKTLPNEYIDEEKYYIENKLVFEDHVMLKKKLDIYSANIKFFEGTNVFAQGQKYIAGYVELYKNNEVKETKIADGYYSTPIVIDDNGVIKSYTVDRSITDKTEGEYWVLENGIYISKTLPNDYNEEDIYYKLNEIPVTQTEDEDVLLYFIHKENSEYNVILGKYISNETNGNWFDVRKLSDANSYLTKYVYSDSKNLHTRSNVFVIAKEDITRTEDISINVYAKSIENISYSLVDSELINENTTGTYYIESENEYIIKNLPEDYSPGTSYYLKNSETIPNEETFLAPAYATIIDLNDTIVSDIEPANPQVGQTWLDSVNNVLKICTGFDENNKAIWQLSSKQQKGKSIYTTKPSEYEIGDLWVVEAPGYYYETSVTESDEGVYWVFNEKTSRYDMVKLPEAYTDEQKYYIGFQEGSMFQAVENSDSTGFNYLHWEDAMSSTTQIINNVSQYMVFDPNSGLKIGQKDDLFYVNIDSKEMGFYDNSDKDKGVSAVKVVSIGSQSANIKNMSVEDSAIFKCEETTFNNSITFATKETNNYTGKFKFQIEENGSLSLVIV